MSKKDNSNLKFVYLSDNRQIEVNNEKKAVFETNLFISKCFILVQRLQCSCVAVSTRALSGKVIDN
jgi:hypothetical protein